MAVNWYVRKLLIHEIDMGMSQAEISRRSGLTPAQISHIKNDARSAGLTAVFKLARPVFRRGEGELIDAALKHWEERGRAEWASERMRVAEAARRQVEAATKRQPSGERPSVKLRSGLAVPPDEAPQKKK
jgi:transcriptional regulator with XRE-family HTH domain